MVMVSSQTTWYVELKGALMCIAILISVGEGVSRSVPVHHEHEICTACCAAALAHGLLTHTTPIFCCRVQSVQCRPHQRCRGHLQGRAA
eukprot:138407-Pelagomonas_calceolata.AAC.4